MKKIFIALAVAVCGLNAYGQGNNTRDGGYDGNYQSLAERLAKIEKKSDMFNLYFNYAASAQVGDGLHGDNDEWGASLKNKQLRIEIKGNLTDKLFYRFRHRLNKATDAKSEDNFAKATDIMMMGYKFNDKFSVTAGKQCQIWGGIEFDVNPMNIYQYSDMVDYMDNFMMGVVFSYKPVPTQEFAFEVSDANNSKFSDEYPAAGAQGIKGSEFPLTYILNWNGSFFDDKLQTRWAVGTQKQAESHNSTMITLGQKLNLPKFQWYFDYYGAFDDLDRLQIATGDGGLRLAELGKSYFEDVRYNSLVTKADFQPADKWGLFVKLMYETASVKNDDIFKDYRKSYGYMGGVEYYPDKTQDLKIFLAYIGRKYDFSDKCGLKDYNTNRIELGFMYRIKAY